MLYPPFMTIIAVHRHSSLQDFKIIWGNPPDLHSVARFARSVLPQWRGQGGGLWCFSPPQMRDSAPQIFQI